MEAHTSPTFVYLLSSVGTNSRCLVGDDETKLRYLVFDVAPAITTHVSTWHFTCVLKPYFEESSYPWHFSSPEPKAHNVSL